MARGYVRELPKHKASEKMQMDLKTKISKLKKEIETQKSKPVKVPASIFLVKVAAP